MSDAGELWTGLWNGQALGRINPILPVAVEVYWGLLERVFNPATLSVGFTGIFD
jgi:hypothetical protein